MEVVTFNLGEEEFCLEISHVREIKEMMPITRVPNVPDFIAGVINLRGQITALINLKRKLGLEDEIPLEKKKIIIAEVKDEVVGLIVDSVSDVLTLSEEEIEQTPKTLSSRVDTKFIKGIAKIDDGERLIIILDLNKLFEEDEWAI
ncbi:hypothetical protein PAP_04495 [Palaeococcus pacificus DY20341]|uniref:CheW-like domain-containing protein n=1 Tax=Palaeococcus pacificus DY20341 TaxID=1343739 RepID=A0A075LRF0_9EURY|nr:hypothetical protein PAP_04495 [Palaeococcus pacificus DY20341]